MRRGKGEIKKDEKKKLQGVEGVHKGFVTFGLDAERSREKNSLQGKFVFTETPLYEKLEMMD